MCSWLFHATLKPPSLPPTWGPRSPAGLQPSVLIWSPRGRPDAEPSGLNAPWKHNPTQITQPQRAAATEAAQTIPRQLKHKSVFIPFPFQLTNQLPGTQTPAGGVVSGAHGGLVPLET